MVNVPGSMLVQPKFQRLVLPTKLVSSAATPPLNALVVMLKLLTTLVTLVLVSVTMVKLRSDGSALVLSGNVIVNGERPAASASGGWMMLTEMPVVTTFTTRVACKCNAVLLSS